MSSLIKNITAHKLVIKHYDLLYDFDFLWVKCQLNQIISNYKYLQQLHHKRLYEITYNNYWGCVKILRFLLVLVLCCSLCGSCPRGTLVLDMLGVQFVKFILFIQCVKRIHASPHHIKVHCWSCFSILKGNYGC